MKRIILFAVLLMTIGASAGTPRILPENEKVATTFARIFKDAGNVRWSRSGNFYDAFFSVASVKIRARLDKNGKLVRIIRYYKEDNLPVNILCSIKKDYPDKEVWGVIEETRASNVDYRIVLRDEKNYIHIGADSQGEITVLAKYNRSDR